jgi:hypothetical protein
LTALIPKQAPNLQPRERVCEKKKKKKKGRKREKEGK